MTASAVILAAGRGERMQAGVRKAFVELGGRPLFVHAVETFSRIERIAEIIVVVHAGDVEAARTAVETFDSRPSMVIGGATRRESSLAGIRAASGDALLIHDGCRPFASRALIERVLDELERHGAVVPVLPSTETLYRLDGERRVSETVDRAAIVRAQTPQGFRRSLILRCLEAADPAVTDDASAVLAQGEPVFPVEGETSNLKVTHPEDLRWAEAFLARSG